MSHDHTSLIMIIIIITIIPSVPGEISYAAAKSKQAKVADEDGHMITIRMQQLIFLLYKVLLQNHHVPRPLLRPINNTGNIAFTFLGATTAPTGATRFHCVIRHVVPNSPGICYILKNVRPELYMFDVDVYHCTHVQRAVDPSSAVNHISYSHYYMCSGR